MVALRADELAEMTPAERKQHAEDEIRNIYGHDVKFDRHGKPIEQGIGSPGNYSENHWQMLAKMEGQEVADRAKAAAVKAGHWPPRRQAEAY
jgi:hypothetical protein